MKDTQQKHLQNKHLSEKPPWKLSGCHLEVNEGAK